MDEEITVGAIGVDFVGQWSGLSNMLNGIIAAVQRLQSVVNSKDLVITPEATASAETLGEAVGTVGTEAKGAGTSLREMSDVNFTTLFNGLANTARGIEKLIELNAELLASMKRVADQPTSPRTRGSRGTVGAGVSSGVEAIEEAGDEEAAALERTYDHERAIAFRAQELSLTAYRAYLDERLAIVTAALDKENILYADSAEYLTLLEKKKLLAGIEAQGPATALNIAKQEYVDTGDLAPYKAKTQAVLDSTDAETKAYLVAKRHMTSINTIEAQNQLATDVARVKASREVDDGQLALRMNDVKNSTMVFKQAQADELAMAKQIAAEQIAMDADVAASAAAIYRHDTELYGAAGAEKLRLARVVAAEIEAQNEATALAAQMTYKSTQMVYADTEAAILARAKEIAAERVAIEKEADALITEAHTAATKTWVAESRAGAAALSRPRQNGQGDAPASGWSMLFAGGMILTPLVASIKSGAEFEAALHKLQATAGDTTPFETLRTELLKVANQFDQLPVDVANAFYPIESAGFHGAEGLKVLSAAAAFARGTQTDLGISTQLVAKTLVAYNLTADSAARVTDILTRAVKNSLVPGKEFTPALASIKATGNAVGLTLEELATGLDLMTQQTKSAATGATYFKNFLMGIVNPAQATRKEAKELGLEWLATGKGMEEIHRVGLAGVLNEIAEATHHSHEAQIELFPDMRKNQAELILLADGGAKFGRVLHDNINSMGATHAANQVMDHDLQQAGKDLESLAATTEASIVHAVEPDLIALAHIVEDLLKWFNALPPSEQEIIVVTSALAGVTLTAIGLFKIFAGGILGVAEKFGLLGVAATGAATAEGEAAVAGTAALGPWGLAIAAIVLAVGGIALAWKNAQDAQQKYFDATHTGDASTDMDADIEQRRAELAAAEAAAHQKSRGNMTGTPTPEGLAAVAQAQQNYDEAVAQKQHHLAGDTHWFDAQINQIDAKLKTLEVPSNYARSRVGIIQGEYTPDVQSQIQGLQDWKNRLVENRPGASSGGGGAGIPGDIEGGFAQSVMAHVFDSISTPAHVASCANFVSAVFEKAGANVPGGAIASAGKLIAWVASQKGVTKVPIAEAGPGDFIAFHGPKFGAGGSGNHVGIGLGDGMVRSSSNGNVTDQSIAGELAYGGKGAYATAYRLPGGILSSRGTIGGQEGSFWQPPSTTGKTKEPVERFTPEQVVSGDLSSQKTSASNYADKLAQVDAVAAARENAAAISGKAWDKNVAMATLYSAKLILAENAVKNIGSDLPKLLIAKDSADANAKRINTAYAASPDDKSLERKNTDAIEAARKATEAYNQGFAAFRTASQDEVSYRDSLSNAIAAQADKIKEAAKQSADAVKLILDTQASIDEIEANITGKSVSYEDDLTNKLEASLAELKAKGASPAEIARMRAVGGTKDAGLIDAQNDKDRKQATEALTSAQNEQWSDATQMITGWKDALEAGTITAQQYIAALRELQTGDLTAKQSAEISQDIFEEQMQQFDKYKEAAKKTADDVAGYFGKAFDAATEKGNRSENLRKAGQDALKEFEKKSLIDTVNKYVLQIEMKGHKPPIAPVTLTPQQQATAWLGQFVTAVNPLIIALNNLTSAVTGKGPTVVPPTTRPGAAANGTVGVMSPAYYASGGKGTSGGAAATVASGLAAVTALQGIDNAANAKQGTISQSTADIQAVTAGAIALGAKGSGSSPVTKTLNTVQSGVEVANKALSLFSKGTEFTSKGTNALLGGMKTIPSATSGLMAGISKAMPYIGLAMAAAQMLGVFGNGGPSKYAVDTTTQQEHLQNVFTDYSPVAKSAYVGAEGLRALLGPTSLAAAGLHSMSAPPAVPVSHTINVNTQVTGNADPMAIHNHIIDQTQTALANLLQIDNARRGIG